MPDTFEWPDQDALQDEQTFRMWLIKAMQRIHVLSAETTRLQAVANGRVGKLEAAVADLPKAETLTKMAETFPTIIVKVSLMEKIVFGAAGTMLVAILSAVLAMVIRR